MEKIEAIRLVLAESEKQVRLRLLDPESNEASLVRLSFVAGAVFALENKEKFDKPLIPN